MYGIQDGKLQLIDDSAKLESNSDSFDLITFTKKLYLLELLPQIDTNGYEIKLTNFSKPFGYDDSIKFILTWIVFVNDVEQWRDVNDLVNGQMWSMTDFSSDEACSYEIYLNDVLIEKGFKKPIEDVFDIVYPEDIDVTLLFDNKITEEQLPTMATDEWVHLAAKTKNWELIVDELKTNNVSLELYQWPLVTSDFCDMLIKKAEEKGEWTSNRHANYPTHDMLLTDLDFDDHYSAILREYAIPTVGHIWGIHQNKLDSVTFENFIVKYDNNSEDFQNHLGVHLDDSNCFTFVLGLNTNYEGGGTWFPKQQILLNRDVGVLTVHPQPVTHKHGARVVTKGIRYVLISFCTI